MIEQKNLGFEKAILIGIITNTQDEDRVNEYLTNSLF